VKRPSLPAGLALRVGRRLPPNVRRFVNAARGIDVPAMVERPPGRHVAVLAPHPDDELAGCGGTIAKHARAGEPVTVVLMTSGERTASMVASDPVAARARREGEARAACTAVGLAEGDLVFLRLPEGGIGLDGRAALVAALSATAADLVYAPNPVDAHRDHRATTELLAAALPDLYAVRHVALYEVWTPVYPTCLVDISATIDAKLEGLGRYASALASVDYLHTIRGLAAYRSGQGLHGRGYAEAFCVLERTPFTELMASLA